MSVEEAPAADGQNARPGAILFMCGMNAIRSPMAEVIAKRLLPHDIYVQSAGVRAGDHDPFVEVVLSEIGLTMPKRHQPRTLDELEDDYFDVIVTLSPEAHHQALELTRSSAVEVIYWPTLDPSVEAELWRRIEARFARTGVQQEQRI